MEEGTQKVVSVTYGRSNEHIYLTNDSKMKNLRAKIIKLKIGKSTQKNTRNDEFSVKLFDAIYENNFELAIALIDGGKVDVNIKNECGAIPLIATCRQTTLKTEDEAAKFIN